MYVCEVHLYVESDLICVCLNNYIYRFPKCRRTCDCHLYRGISDFQFVSAFKTLKILAKNGAL